MKKSKNAKTIKETKKADSLWRKPITLDSFEDEEPLAALYQGREVSKKSDKTGKSAPKRKTKTSKPAVKTRVKPTTQVKAKIIPAQPSEPQDILSEKVENKSKGVSNTKVSEDELKSLLKIKSESFQFTDIREILRGKSFDIYTYLCCLAGNAGVCKIKHLDLMNVLEISRPTLFKQSDWLIRLSLIEKTTVPGDHLGTSYKVNRLEEILPISKALVEQLQSHIKSFKK